MEEEQRAKGGRGGARPGAGRKTTGVAGKTASVTLRISPKEKEVIERKAAETGKTVSRYMIDLALGL